MTKRKADRARCDIQERKKRRKQKGPLRHLIIQPATLLRYREAVHSFFLYQRHFIVVPMVAWTAMSLDDMLQRWIEDLWETGETKNLPNDAISGLQHFIPALRGQLWGASRFLSAWGRHELPTRATPLSALFVSALAGTASLARDFPMAVGFLLAFHAFLRPTELCNVEWKNLIFFPNHSRALLTLPITKSGRRTGRKESVIIDDPFLCQALHRLQNAHAATRRTRLLRHDSATFRNRFAIMIELAGLPAAHWRPTSLRRGGATEDFLRHGQLDRTMLRGRWKSQKTARIYIDAAMQDRPSTQMCPSMALRFNDLAEATRQRLLAL